MKVTVIPTGVCTLGTLVQELEDLQIRGRVVTIQNSASLRSARILGRKEIFMFFRASNLEPHHQMKLSIILRTPFFVCRCLTFLLGIQLAYSMPHQQGEQLNLRGVQRHQGKKFIKSFDFKLFVESGFNNISLCCRTTSTDLLALSRHPSLSSIAPGRSSRLYSVSAQSCCI